MALPGFGVRVHEQRGRAAVARRRALIALFGTLAMAAVSYSMLQALIAPALPLMAGQFGVSAGTTAWVVTAFLLTASVATPVLGRLGDMFGRRRYLLIALGVVAVGTCVTALAGSLGVILVGRAIQGVGGAVFPLSFGIIRDEFPPARTGSAIGVMSGMLGIAGGAGMVISGPVSEHASLHWTFAVPLVFIIPALVGTMLFVPDRATHERRPMDWRGAGLLGTVLTTLLLGIGEGPRSGWASREVVLLVSAAIVIGGLWARFESRVSEPLIDLRLLRGRGVWPAHVIAVLVGFGVFSSFLLIPRLVEAPRQGGIGLGVSISTAGLFMLPSTACMLTASLTSGALARRLGWAAVLRTGACCSTASFAWLIFAHAQPWQIIIASALQGLGTGCAYAALPNVILAVTPQTHTGIATGINVVMRTIGGALGSQVIGTILTVTATTQLVPAHRFILAFTIAASLAGTAIITTLLIPSHTSLNTLPTTPPLPEAALSQ